jgi:cystathionine gamma-synthase
MWVSGKCGKLALSHCRDASRAQGQAKELRMRFQTLAVHAGGEPDAETGAVVPPIHLATTYEHAPDGSRDDGLQYQRADNPTQRRLETALAALEGGSHALFFSAGIAAGSALLHSLPRGSRVIVARDLYAGFRSLFSQLAERWDVVVEWCDLTDLDAVGKALQRPAALLWAETPSNPLLRVSDIAALATLAHAAGARLLVDNTFATPALQQPLALGADVVLHSATKYMGGHSDVMGGVLVFADDIGYADARNARELIGLNASPFAAWMVLRGLRSLSARMAMHCANAQRVAAALAAQSQVEAVHFPGLTTHPGHAIAAAQMRDFGGMLSFQVKGGRDAALRAAGRLRLFINATSLGGCESLIEHRASVEGAKPTSPLNLLRLSVGLEDADDLIADLDQALR